ncbi:MAG: hypothetical protein WCR52_20465 [Bacteroidota bacterium]
MEKKQLPKSYYFIAAAFSLSAFLFVNIHAELNIGNSIPGSELAQPKVEDSSPQKDYDVPAPDVTVLGKVFELAEKLLPLAR